MTSTRGDQGVAVRGMTIQVVASPSRTESIEALLEGAGCTITVTEIDPDIRSQLASTSADCVLLDHELSGTDIVAVVESLRAVRPLLPIIALTGDDPELACDVLRAGATEVVRSEPDALSQPVLLNRVTTAIGGPVVASDLSHEGEGSKFGAVDETTLLDRVTDAFIALDDEWRFTYLNARAEELINPDGTTLIGANIWEEFSAAADTSFEENYREAMESQEPVSFEEYYPPLATWFSVWAYPSESGLSVFFRDVTDRKRRERALEEYRTIVETIPDGAYSLDEDQRFRLVNDAFVEMTGYDRSELLGSHVSIVGTDEGISRGRELREELRSGERDVAILEETVETADGDTFSAEIRFTLLPSDGEVRGTVGVLRDVTERKRNEDELRRNQESLQQLYSITSSTDLSFEEKLDRLLHLGCERLDLDIGFLSSIDESESDFEIVHAIGDHELIQADVQSPLGETYCRHVVESDGLVAFKDAESEGMATDPAYEKFDLGCYIGGMVLVDGSPRGTLCFAARSARATPFSEFERTFVELVSEWVGYELERTERERILHDRVRQQDAVSRLGQEALAVDDLDSFMREVTAVVADVLGNEYCKVLELDEDTRELLLRQGVGWDEGIVGNATVAADDNSQAGYTLLTEGPVIVTDLESETRFSGPDLLTSHDVVSGVSVIIGSIEEPWGILGTHDTERREFTEYDAHFVQTVANILANVIDRVRRERELERYETIVQTVNDGIYIVDEDGYFTMVNEAYVEMSGYSREQLIGAHVSLLVDDDVIDQAGRIEREMRSGEIDVPTLEASLRTTDGDEFPVEATFALLSSGENVERIGVVRDVTERKRREDELERQRTQLATLNNLNLVIQDINRALVESSTKEEIERQTVDRLVEADPYLLAWIGDVDRGERTVSPRVSAGRVGYLDDLEITFDDSETAQGPTGRALKTHEIQIVQDVANDPSYEPWREAALEHGFRASAAIPIVHEETLHGVLNVYSDRPDAFSEPERSVIAQLGEIIGHAIGSIERKKALMSDTLTELEFRLRDPENPIVRLTADEKATISVERTVPVGDGSFVQFFTVSGIDPEEFQQAMEDASTVESIRLVDDRGDACLFEVMSQHPPMTETFARYGGRITSAIVEDGELRIIAEIPQDAETREVLEAIRDEYPGIELAAQRTTTREHQRASAHPVLDGSLTDRQRAALESAYFSGFFEWPRSTTGEEVAESLDISASTFSQHLRAAERKVFESLLEDERGM